MAELVADNQRHPCYNQEAHHFFARMHVAVAPKCNIQCKFCNRKYDCVNESRPGVTSELLTPVAASQKVLAVGASMKNLTVVGIAGPGDPLANTDKTFRTLELIKAKAPDMQLCLSTNGLALNDHIKEISQLGIRHVTVTVNAVDPQIGKEIYQFVRWKNKTLHGLEAATQLLHNQLEGIQKLVELGVLVKINSVLIPGVNDEHMIEISKLVREMGVFTHNIMPLLIADGSIYHKEGKLPASSDLLAKVQKRSQSIVPLMRHCRQCRADAVGTLGQDRHVELSAESAEELALNYSVPERVQEQQLITERMIAYRRMIESKELTAKLRKMVSLSPFRAAVATTGNGKVNEHFGHAKEFQVYEVSQQGIHFMSARKVDSYCADLESCVDDHRMQGITDMLQDCRYLVCQHIGSEPKLLLESRHIHVATSQDFIEQALFLLAEQEVLNLMPKE